MLGLDISSITAFVLFGFSLWILIFLIHIIGYKSTEKNLKIYVLGKSLQLIVCLVYFFYPENMDGSLLSMTTPILYAGGAIEVFVFYLYSGKEIHNTKKQLIWITVVASILFVLLRENITIRVVLTSVYFVYVYGLLVFGYALNKDSSRIQKAVGWIAILFVAVNAFRGFFTVLKGVELPVFSNEPIQIFTGLVWAAVAITSPLLFLFVIKENDYKNLVELNATKSKFFRIIGHDLKGPIGQFINFFDLIENNYDKLSTEEIKKFLKAMKDSSERSYKLLENLLDWARSQTGAIKYNPTSISVLELVNDNIALLHRQAELKNIAIITTELEDREIYADQNMLSTVLRNLISNAIKYSNPNSTISINATQKVDSFCFCIHDEGVGIREADIDKLFKIDGGLKTDGTQNEKGTGLGLILCKEFIDQHKGTIEVQSEFGKGSRFSVLIPS